MAATRELTIDVCVLMAAAGSAAHYGDQKANALVLLWRMRDEERWAYAVDGAGRIDRQYKEKLRDKRLEGREAVRQWLSVMRSRGKWTPVYERDPAVDARASEKIREAGLTPEDAKYVMTAAGTNTQRLISYNSHCYTRENRHVLRQIPVHVVGPTDACKP